MEEEGLPEVFRCPQVVAPGAHQVARRTAVLGLRGHRGAEVEPGPVPTGTIARLDLLRDGEALAHVGHARIRLADAALQLAVERFVVEIQLHAPSPDARAPISATRHP